MPQRPVLASFFMLGRTKRMTNIYLHILDMGRYFQINELANPAYRLMELMMKRGW
ncbi:hypothetical protein D3C76_78800 [compost metagenome]